MDIQKDELTKEEDRGKKYRLAFLNHPVEDDDVDYKSANLFVGKGDDFSVSLVKDILGMANSGGGFIVIGFKEDTAKRIVPQKPIDEMVLASYETTKLSQFVNHYTAGADRVRLTVHKDELDGQHYPVIEIFGFEKRPFFCRSTVLSQNSKKTLLKEGVLYIRVPGAQIVEVASPDDWERLIDICVERRRGEFLKSFNSLLQETGLSSKQLASESVSDSQKKEIEQWEKKNRDEVKKNLKVNGFKDDAFFESTHYLVESKKNWSSPDLLEVARKSELRNTGWPIGIVPRGDESAKPMEDGVKAIMASSDTFDYWYLRKNGSYYFARVYREDTMQKRQSDDGRRVDNKPILYFEVRIWRIAEIILHCTTLYRQLGVASTEKVHIKITHNGIAGRTLTARDPDRSLIGTYTAGAKKSVWETEASLDKLNAFYGDFVMEASAKLFEMFDFLKLEESVYKGIISEFLNSRL